MLSEILLVFLSKLRQLDLQTQGLILLLASLSLAQPHPTVWGCQTL